MQAHRSLLLKEDELHFALRVSSRGVLWGGAAVLAILIALIGFLGYHAVPRLGYVLACGLFGISCLLALLTLVSFSVMASHADRSLDHADAAVREREEWLSTTLASIGDAVIVTDTAGAITFLNPVAQSLLRRAEDDALGRSVSEVFCLFDEYSGLPAELPLDLVTRDGFVTGTENHSVLRRADGDQIPISHSAAPVRGRRGRIAGAVVVFRDISQQREIERTLRVSEKLAATGKLAATVAHEVNNPLEAATNILYLLRGDPGLSEKGHELLAAADEQLGRIAHITRQTLSFYRNTTAREPLNVAAACDHVLEAYRDRIAAKHVTIERVYDEGLAVRGTSGELAQVLSNLVANALDAVTPEGSISVAVFAGANDNVFVTVHDDGCGIDPAELERIFEPFYTTKKDIGTGLGLWVTRELVEKMGGRVSASSDGPGFGAQFALSLPTCTRKEDESRVSIA